ncbi:MAG: N-acetylmuramoyl-L-alanine amidase [Bacteroidales bacterium]|nr:N-acetylmuramoyl-L-alanine amidase [Bacteroidales bacterium]
MKNLIIYLFLLLCSFSITAQDNLGKIKTVVLDAGHGGDDPGAVGSRCKEKDIALDVVLKTGALIKQHFPDVKVIYTRDRDVFVKLIDRAQIANNNQADLFISVHCNSAKSSDAVGAETFVMGLSKSAANLETAKKENASILLEANYMENYDGFNPNSDEDYIAMTLFQSAYIDQSLQIAQKVQNQLTGNVGKRHDRGVKQAGFLVLYKASLPSILVELGFISNRTEESFLMSEDGKKSMANAIFLAFKEYKTEFESNNSSSSSPPSTSPTDTQPTISDTNSDDNTKPLTYYVQIAASKKKMNTKSFKNLTDVSEKYYNGNYIYLTAKTSSAETAKKSLDSVKKKGYKDAFIVAFMGDKRLTLKEAEAIK